MKRIYTIGVLVFYVFVAKKILQVSKSPFSYKKLFSLLVFVFFGCITINQTAYGQCNVTLGVSSTNSTCPGCNNGTASVTVAGGTAPYTYVWTNNVSAGTININPVKDNSIYEQDVTHSNGTGEYLVAGMTNAGFRNRALMAFDIAGNIPANASITGASLQMTVTLTSGASGPQEHTLYKILENWGEGTSVNNSQPGQGAPAAANDATWLKTFFPNSDWADIGGTYEPLASAMSIVNNPAQYTWSSPELLQDVQSWYTNPSLNFGWLLRSDETGNRQAKRYGSRQNPVSTNRPILTINYGPGVIGTASSVSNLAPGMYTVTVTDALGCTATTSVSIILATTIPTVISQNYVLTNDRTWVLDGKVYVQGGATLSIDEGTVIKGVKKSTPDQASILVITRSGRIEANGTITNPIVFTSNETNPQSGDWGGIIILGSAPLNSADLLTEGINPSTVPAGTDVFYGGGAAGAGNAEENKGTLKYVRIEYGGIIDSFANALNALSLYAVGRGTLLDYIEVAYAGSDAFEWHGGTVNAKHLLALAAYDDSWDFDYGFQGHLQYCVSVLRLSRPSYSSPQASYPNGIESDNNPFGNGDNPRTNVTISNMTTIGVEDSTNASIYLPAPGSKQILYASRFRRASSLTVRNSIFMGFPVGARFESALTIADAGSYQYNIVHGFSNTDEGASINNTNTEFLGFVTSANDPVLLTNPFDITNPNFRPLTASPAFSGANFSGLVTIPANFFATNIAGTTYPAYRGAFAPGISNWAGTWTRFF